MADVYFSGDAVPIAQVNGGTVGNAVANDVYTITATDQAGGTTAVSHTVAGGESTTNVAAALVALWNDSSSPVLARVTASNASAVITLTADTPGVPFVVAYSVTNNGGSPSWASTGDTTASAGPSDYATTENWSGGAVPGSGDDITLRRGSAPLLYGLNAIRACTKFTVEEGYQGTIGGVDGAYLRLNASSIIDLAGTGVSHIDLQNSNVTCAVRQTAPAGPDSYGLYLKGGDLNEIILIRGSVAFGIEGNDTTSECGTFRVAHDGTVDADVRLTIGQNVSAPGGGAITAITMAGGTVTNKATAGVGTVTVTGGSLNYEAGTITTANIYGGRFFPKSSGTITTANLHGGFTDFTRSSDARTVTNLKLNPSATLRYDPTTLTTTNNVDADRPVEYVAGPGN